MGFYMKNMLFPEIKPFIRYARYVKINSETKRVHTYPCDARLFYTVDGEGEIEVDGTVYKMTKGDILIFNSGTKYCICPSQEGVNYLVLNYDYTSDHSCLHIPVPPKLCESFKESDIIESVSFDDADELSRPIFLKKKYDVSERLLEIEREFATKILYFETRISNILSEILVDCLRELRLQTVPDGYERINTILKFIHDNYNEKLTNLSLGEKFGFHPNYISFLIKSYTGTPLHKYIMNVRISHAIHMLDGGQTSIGEIAESCGFCDIFYFSRIFKQHVGLSPLEYRGKKQ